MIVIHGLSSSIEMVLRANALKATLKFTWARAIRGATARNSSRTVYLQVLLVLLSFHRLTKVRSPFSCLHHLEHHLVESNRLATNVEMQIASY